MNQIRVILELNPTVTSDQYRWPLNNNDSHYYEQFYINPVSTHMPNQVNNLIKIVRIKLNILLSIE